MSSKIVMRLLAAVQNKALLMAAAFGALCLAVAVADGGTIATTPNQLLYGLTGYDLRDYENVYDASGNPVTTRPGAPGDTIQGVFVITQISNDDPASSYYYVPQVPGAVEITGVFDSYISGVDAAGNYLLTPDTTAVAGQKALSGSDFQASYGTGAMLAVYYNNINAMPIGLNGNGIAALSTASQAVSLATTNGGNGSLWATYGQAPGQAWGASNGYYWAAQQAGIGVSTFAASLAMIANDTGLPSSDFSPMTQAPPASFNDPVLFGIANTFVLQGTTKLQTTGPYAIFSTDPAQLNFVPVPEPSSITLAASLFGILSLLGVYRQRTRAMGHRS